MRMENRTPARKVIASTLGVAMTTVLLFLYERLAGQSDPIPVHVIGALQTIVVFATGYYVAPSPRDTIVGEGS